MFCFEGYLRLSPKDGVASLSLKEREVQGMNDWQKYTLKVRCTAASLERERQNPAPLILLCWAGLPIVML